MIHADLTRKDLGRSDHGLINICLGELKKRAKKSAGRDSILAITNTATTLTCTLYCGKR
jgi:hypothetical protein